MIRLWASIILNLDIFITMAVIFYSYRKNHEGEVSWNNIKKACVFFTTLSNVFSALTSLILVMGEIGALRDGAVPYWTLVLKFMGTASVTVTLMTVLLFLGPTQGYPSLFHRDGIFVHLFGPLLSIISFCVLENWYPLSFGMMLLGILPMLCYGIYYYHQVVVLGEDKGGWKDFYGFNRGGKWKISFAAMLVGTFLLSLGLMALHNLFVH